jgi:integrase
MLTDRQVKTLKPKRGQRSILKGDGGNLYMQATRSESGGVNRSWIFRFQLPGRSPRHMGLGCYPDVALSQAREEAAKARKLVGQGLDPIMEHNAAISANLAKSAVQLTFAQCTDAYVRQHRASWKNPGTEADWKQSLVTHAYPILGGKLNVADVARAHVVQVLETIWYTQPVIASVVRQRIESVLNLAISRGLRVGENPAAWKLLKDEFPAVAKIHKVKHRAALDFKDVPGFMEDLRKVEMMAARALEFCVLTCVRSDDIRDAKVTDVDIDERIWTIKEFSKTHREHRVPLSDRALDVLKRVQALKKMLGGPVAKSEYLFPSDKHGGQIGINAMLEVIAKMGLKGTVTVHGMRASFRTWTNDVTHFSRDICEVCLGHTVGDETENAYQRGDALVKRSKVMAAWGAFLAKPPATDKTGKVVPLKRGAR